MGVLLRWEPTESRARRLEAHA
jgi:hypothetical protein